MTRARLTGGFGLLVASCVAAACAPAFMQSRAQELRSPAAPIAQLWSDPKDLAQRNLIWGPGRAASAPSARDPYAVLEVDRTGASPGYDAVGPDGRTWSIKVGPEVQPEIVLSRILWALGYHQPETYFLRDWQLTSGDWKYEGEPARFRLQSDHETDGEWAWVDNPFAGSAPMHGLIAINLLFGNWDVKTSNNRVYVLSTPGAQPARRFVVQDLGASLGKCCFPPFVKGTKNDIEDFEGTFFLKKVDGDEVRLNYRGPHSKVFSRVSLADVTWACERMNRLSDAQFDDAFKAADYPEDVRQRYVRKIREKIREGLALRPVATGRAGARS
jgi:hypothetical protein